MDYKKPQSTLVQGGVGLYPLTTADQVILSDGSRLEKGGKINADKLGGKTLAEIMLALYPVGSIYMSVSDTSPASLFGGTWEQMKDRFLLGAGDSYAAGSTGGEAAHTLNTGEMPEHNHLIPVTTGSGMLSIPSYTIRLTEGSWESNQTPLDNVNAGEGVKTGEGIPHNNMPPYLVVYMWKRVS